MFAPHVVKSYSLSGRIFLTGGTGTIGQALLRRAHTQEWPCTFTVYSRDENKQSRLRAYYPKHRYVLGDVRQREWLQVAMAGHDLVIHAAAIKVVPSAEVNPSECVRTNIEGSHNVFSAAVANRVPKAVCISTDKSVSPCNLYGATKMVMERLAQEACSWGDATDFGIARYGNVIGSTASVVPYFRDLASKGLPITITEWQMTRFWLSIQDAVNVILLAVHETTQGQIVVPQAPAMRMVDVAGAIVPGHQMVNIGIRPGEKIHEALLHRFESMRAVEHDGYWKVDPPLSDAVRSLDESFEYTSDQPKHWLTAEEFLTMAGDQG